MSEPRTDVEAAWRELEADALASDGPIRDVRDAIKRRRPLIEAAIRAEGLDVERRAVREATEAMARTLPVLIAVRAWRDTPRDPHDPAIGARLEQALIDAIGDLDEYARLGGADDDPQARIRMHTTIQKLSLDEARAALRTFLLEIHPFGSAERVLSDSMVEKIMEREAVIEAAVRADEVSKCWHDRDVIRSEARAEYEAKLAALPEHVEAWMKVRGIAFQLPVDPNGTFYPNAAAVIRAALDAMEAERPYRCPVCGSEDRVEHNDEMHAVEARAEAGR